MHDTHAEVAREYLNLRARCHDYGVPHHRHVPQRDDDSSRQGEVHGVTLLCGEGVPTVLLPGTGRMFLKGYEGADG